MITLIAESKTMNLHERIIDDSIYTAHRPAFEEKADAIMEYLSEMSPYELSQRISISHNLAAKTSMMIYDFPNKKTGLPALEAFTGEVFRAIETDTLPSEAIEFATRKLFIISSLYGLLKTDDVIKPYRLDYNADCSPSGGILSKYWKSKLTIALVNHLRGTNEHEILNLLPSEASKCIDWKVVKAFARVEAPEFKTLTKNATLKTPHSRKIKELRGDMVRYTLTERIDSLREILSLETSRFSADVENHRKGIPRFLVNE